MISLSITDDTIANIYREQLLHINKYYISNVHEGGKPDTMPWPVNSPDRRTCVFTT